MYNRPGQPPEGQPAYHYPPPGPPNPQPGQVSAQPSSAAYSPITAGPPPQTGPLPPIGKYRRPPSEMALHHHPPPPQGAYHQPPPPGYPPPPHHPHYAPPPYRTGGHDPYRQAPGGYPYPQQHQPAPRQRTAIACRYCRRRKIRCSGFDQSDDGKCANCQRFGQDCVFTPVSAQAQAFVPAHAVYGRGQAPPPVQLYGAFGQPLPASHAQHDPYAASRAPGYALPSPTSYYPPAQSHAGPYPPPQAGVPPPQGQYPPAPLDQISGVTGSRKRANDEPHTPSLPPPNPAASGTPADYRYPDPTAVGAAPVSPASNVSQQSAQQPQQPYYPPQPQQLPLRRTPPQAASPYGQDGRASASPHGHPEPAYPAYPGGDLKPPAGLAEGRTPPPRTSTPSQPSQASSSQAGGGAARPGLSISSIVSGEGSNSGSRSAEDRDMLKRLG